MVQCGPSIEDTGIFHRQTGAQYAGSCIPTDFLVGLQIFETDVIDAQSESERNNPD